MKNKNLIESFNYALQGIVQAVKQERNLKFHLCATILVLIISKLCNISKVEFLIIILTCTIVIFAELINTAIETIIDLVCGTEYNPLAKIAKDVAAGAVLISAVSSVVIGYVIFYDKVSELLTKKEKFITIIPTNAVIICLIIVVIITIVIKIMKGRTSLLSGGMPSGHSAVAFASATAVFFLNNSSTLITILAFLLAVLVAQSRYEGKIHSFIEIIIGSLIGCLSVIIIFKILL